MPDPVMQNDSSPDMKNDSSPIPNGYPSVNARGQGSLLGYTVVALGLALFIRFFIAAPYVVSGQSMEPNFKDWEYLIVDRVSYDFGGPERGDVVIFNQPGTKRALIKRVIGLPGETIVLSDNTVTVQNAEHPEGFVISEPYLEQTNMGGITEMKITLEPDRYFVLGDNRRVSSDSRIWGTLPREDIVGQVLLRLYPFNDIDVLPSRSRYTDTATPAGN